MCDDCGCGDPEKVPVEIQESLLAATDRTARPARAVTPGTRLSQLAVRSRTPRQGGCEL